ncbi:hypothetical protein TREMEDRAFT_41900 [Tremella mesenterica DSM 1558]|uniref:uncharacterized protein n=1 Tax=Tremella mesenterica (strain ATCC 24925 / CBS 8224 / DSM 1558 / NBRC 9311 / NRRL Y-6157 / RJB 2259-6 / UBC 559-6) TaxID=578456 RepID=UPI0003F49079|nr:uncharacterized protein TREMEDRAFT_41900 [Tremella mesenterica DSM 1558]EIW72658.1 hypothetical protein TREMEDRAFT_41900 [Tremella mesenterica DSM 1558]
MFRQSRRTIHVLRDQPTPSLERLSKRARLLPSSPIELETSSSSRILSFPPSHALSSWSAPPRTLLLVQKPDDSRVRSTMESVLSHLTTRYPHLRLIVEPHTARDHPEFHDLTVVEKEDRALLGLHTELILTLGGDGTVLHVSNLFGQGECPPVLCFSMGSLGFLLPFHIDSLAEALHTTLTGPVPVLNRMRLACTPVSASGEVLDRCSDMIGDAGWQVMNEVTLHRGGQRPLVVVDAYFDGQHLTEAVADGLLLSTPTGSTAYSLAAGGPISHPETDAFLLTPIAPRSLSFRTVILPGRGVVKLQVSDRSRAPAELLVDGREICMLHSGESVIIAKSPFPIPCIERSEGGNSWVRDINSLLQFNVGFRNKSLAPGGSGD